MRPNGLWVKVDESVLFIKTNDNYNMCNDGVIIEHFNAPLKYLLLTDLSVLLEMDTFSNAV